MNPSKKLLHSWDCLVSFRKWFEVHMVNLKIFESLLEFAAFSGATNVLTGSNGLANRGSQVLFWAQILYGWGYTISWVENFEDPNLGCGLASLEAVSVPDLHLSITSIKTIGLSAKKAKKRCRLSWHEGTAHS